MKYRFLDMVNTKSLPKGSVRKFALQGQKLRGISKENKGGTTSSFYIKQLPKIPRPSAELKKALKQFGVVLDTSDSLYTGDVRLCRPIKKTTKVNAFLAYRAFYGRFIPKVEAQREFSITLGKVWLVEKNKNHWKRYAAEYNGTSTNLQFPEWLETILGNKYYVKLNNLWGYQKSTVEDVYFTT